MGHPNSTYWRVDLFLEISLVVGLLGQMELFSQVWLFWVAPILGAIMAGFFYVAMFDSSEASNA
jgi:Major intrinsic protein